MTIITHQSATFEIEKKKEPIGKRFTAKEFKKKNWQRGNIQIFFTQTNTIDRAAGTNLVASSSTSVKREKMASVWILFPQGTALYLPFQPKMFQNGHSAWRPTSLSRVLILAPNSHRQQKSQTNKIASFLFLEGAHDNGHFPKHFLVQDRKVKHEKSSKRCAKNQRILNSWGEGDIARRRQSDKKGKWLGQNEKTKKVVNLLQHRQLPS